MHSMFRYLVGEGICSPTSAFGIRLSAASFQKEKHLLEGVLRT